MQALSDDGIIQATCAVLIDGKVKGTAWLVSEEGHLLTAGHLLGTENPRESVEIRFPEDIPRTAYKILWGYQREMGIDFAVLKLANPPANRRPLPISLARSVTGTFRLCGYGQSLVDLSICRGAFLGFYDRQNSPANRLFKLDSKQVGQGGYSGGAVVSDELQAVVAVQIAATGALTGAERDTVLAMPLYRIAKHWEALETFITPKETLVQSDVPKQTQSIHIDKKETPPNLHNQIVEFLTSLPNIQDKNERRALIFSVSLDKALEHQIVFDGPTGQFFQLLVHTLVSYGRQKDGRDPLIALLEAAKNKVGQDRKAVCDRLLQLLRKGVQRDREQAIAEEEPKIDITLRKIKEMDEITGVKADTTSEGSTKVTIEDVKKGKKVTGVTIKKV